MSERKPFSTWHVVLMIVAIIFLVIGVILISYGVTQLSLHVNRSKPASFWTLTIIGIVMVVLAIIMMLVFWYWHRQNQKHCTAGWVSGSGMRPGCGKEAIEAKHVEVPFNISQGPTKTHVIPAHMHPAPMPINFTHKQLHAPPPMVTTSAYTHAPAPYLHNGHIHNPPTHTHLQRTVHQQPPHLHSTTQTIHPASHTVGLTTSSSSTRSINPVVGLDTK
jgi:hypothetical protein